MSTDDNKDSGESSKSSHQTSNSDHQVIKDDEAPAREIGGRKGPEPTRFGDWEKSGRCIDF